MMSTVCHSRHFVGILLLLALLTTRCTVVIEPPSSTSGAAPPTLDAAPPSTPDEPLTLEFASAYPSGDIARAEQAIIDGWMADHPEIKVQRSGAVAGPQTYLTSATPPDVFGVFPAYDLAPIISNGQAIDLAEAWTESGLFEGLPAGWQSAVSQQGQQIYFPVVYSWQAIYYNKAIFAEHNLTPPQSWEEFLALCATLSSQGVTPLVLDGSAYGIGMLWFEEINLRLNGARFHHALVSGQASFDDERVRNVLTLWQELFDEGYFLEEAWRFERMSSLRAIMDQPSVSEGTKAAMTLSESWWLTQLPPEAWEEIGFFRFPIIDEAVPTAELVYSYGYVIPAGAAHKEEALSLLAAFGAAEGQTAWLQPDIHNPFFAPMRTDFEVDSLAPALRQPLAMIQAADEVVEPLIYALPDTMRSRIDSAFLRFVDNPQAIDEFMAEMEAARQAALEQGLFPPQQ
jgi:ABC-type glycerol-3-phosphate transport system substrate-binding protein